MAEAHELLKKFYHHLLINTKEGQEALDYLLSRGFTKELINEFQIGYALDSWDFITLTKGRAQMSLEKTTRMNYLFDFYQSLLTSKQKSYMSLYYLDDFSLAK